MREKNIRRAAGSVAGEVVLAIVPRYTEPQEWASVEGKVSRSSTPQILRKPTGTRRLSVDSVICSNSKGVTSAI